MDIDGGDWGLFGRFFLTRIKISGIIFIQSKALNWASGFQ